MYLNILWDILLHSQTNKVLQQIPCFLEMYLLKMVQTRTRAHQVHHLPRDRLNPFTPCVRQNDRFVNPSGSPLQPGTVIICNKIPFTVFNNGKIYNFTGGSFKQLYVTDPSEHKFLVALANSPSTFSSIINSVTGLFPRFSSKQTNSDKHKNKHQVQPLI